MLSLSAPTTPSPSSPSPPSCRRISSSPLTLNYHHRHHIRPLRIRNIDAAQPWDYESRLSNPRSHDLTTTIGASFPNLKIGIVGFGNYGQFLAKTLIRQGHTVIAHSRTNYSQIASDLGVAFFSDPHDLCEEHPEVILLCTSILSTESVLRSLPLQSLKRNTLFVDVLSVKEFPRHLFLKILPRDFDILCTHPMFGPESGKLGWNGLPFVYDKVRIGKSEARVKRCDNFINAFEREGCRMVEMSCAEHDQHAAGSQFITHTMGRLLENLKLESTPINTKGYESLLNLVDNTSKDSFELFNGLFLYNKNAIEQLERMDLAFEKVKQQLFGNLHGLLRKQMFEGTELDVVEKKSRFLPEFSQKDSSLSPSSDSKKEKK